MSTPVELEHVRPAPITFCLRATMDHVHTFRKLSLADSVWIKDTMGKPLSEIFKAGNEIPFSQLARLWLHQIADPKPFAPGKETVRDEDTGEETEVFVSGSKKLMAAVDEDEFPIVHHKFLLCIGIKPVVAKPGEPVSAPAQKKKSKKSAGPKSSTR